MNVMLFTNRWCLMNMSGIARNLGCGLEKSDLWALLAYVL